MNPRCSYRVRHSAEVGYDHENMRSAGLRGRSCPRETRFVPRRVWPPSRACCPRDHTCQCHGDPRESPFSQQNRRCRAWHTVEYYSLRRGFGSIKPLSKCWKSFWVHDTIRPGRDTTRRLELYMHAYNERNCLRSHAQPFYESSKLLSKR